MPLVMNTGETVLAPGVFRPQCCVYGNFALPEGTRVPSCPRCGASTAWMFVRPELNTRWRVVSGEHVGAARFRG